MARPRGEADRHNGQGRVRPGRFASQRIVNRQATLGKQVRLCDVAVRVRAANGVRAAGDTNRKHGGRCRRDQSWTDAMQIEPQGTEVCRECRAGPAHDCPAEYDRCEHGRRQRVSGRDRERTDTPGDSAGCGDEPGRGGKREPSRDRSRAGSDRRKRDRTRRANGPGARWRGERLFGGRHNRAGTAAPAGPRARCLPAQRAARTPGPLFRLAPQEGRHVERARALVAHGLILGPGGESRPGAPSTDGARTRPAMSWLRRSTAPARGGAWCSRAGPRACETPWQTATASHRRDRSPLR